MPYLRIISLVCEVPEENDQDEIFIKLKDKKVWPTDKRFVKMDVDDSVKIGLKIKINNPGKLVIELWDFDLTSQNDHLGDFHLQITNLTPGQYTELLDRNPEKAKRASYYLNWAITEE